MIGTLIFYNSIIILSTLFVFLSEKTQKKGIGFFFLCIAFFIVFFSSAFRYGIGADYFSYIQIYENISDFEHLEIGYLFLNKILLFFGLESDWLFIAASFITYLCFFISYPKKSKTIFHFFLIVTFYFVSFNLVRSSIAMGFLLVAVMQYVNYKSFFRYVFFIFLASLFHKTAILYLVFAPFLNKNCLLIIKRNYLVIIILVLAALIFKAQILTILLQSGIVDLLGYSVYIEHYFYSRPVEYGTGLGVLGKFLILLFPIILYKKILNQNKFYYLFVLIIISCFLSLVFSLQMQVLDRIEMLFVIAYCFSVYVVYNTNGIPLKSIYVFCSIIFVLVVFNKAIFDSSTDYRVTCNSGRLYPYVSIFNKKDSNRIPELTSTQRQCENYFNTKE